MGGWQSRARAKSVRRLPLELHLTLFPQGNVNERLVHTNAAIVENTYQNLNAKGTL
jgi:hypothetical protein